MGLQKRKKVLQDWLHDCHWFWNQYGHGEVKEESMMTAKEEKEFGWGESGRE